jgi:hypothetical protein
VRQSGLRRRSQARSGLANSDSALLNVPLAAFNPGLELICHLQLVLKKILKPLTKLRLLFSRQHSHIGFDFRECLHIEDMILCRRASVKSFASLDARLLIRMIDTSLN